VAQRKKDAKRRATRDAGNAESLANGLGKLSMPGIARRANVSAGTLYIYYPSKDEMIESVYLEIKTLLHAEMMEGQAGLVGSAAKLRGLWYAMFHFTLKHPLIFAFHEAVDPETILGPNAKDAVSAMAQEVRAVIETAILDATLKPMPINAVVAMLLGPAIVLARRMIAEDSADHDQIDHVYDAIWAGIARAPSP